VVEAVGGQASSEEVRRRDAVILAVAHDLRASMSAISGSLEMLRTDLVAELPARAASVLDAMADAVADAERVMVNLFDAERLEHGAAELVRAPTHLGALVQRVVDRSSDPARLRLEVDDVVVPIDPGLTERLLANLVGNALAHTPAGTPITVCARREGDHVILHVDDEGPGIPPELRSAVFEPFHGSTGGGTGVGLYLVREFARLHGGDAWIEEGPGGGASVRVRLPIG
jgi:two-component system, OmpR family, sensor histidine kinase KdpD